MPNPTFHTSTSLPCILDVEASGFGAGSYPIEIGLALPNGHTYCSLINPPLHWQHWDAAAEQVHGISRDLLHQHGRPPQTIALELNRLLKHLIIYTDAWYHDHQWLSRLYDEAELTPSYTLKDLRDLLAPSQQASWQHIRAEVEQRLCLSRHRASNDAKILQETWLQSSLSMAQG